MNSKLFISFTNSLHDYIAVSSDSLLFTIARRAGSDGSMSASGSTGLGFNPWQVNLGARRGGDVHFLITRLNFTGLD